MRLVTEIKIKHANIAFFIYYLPPLPDLLELPRLEEPLLDPRDELPLLLEPPEERFTEEPLLLPEEEPERWTDELRFDEEPEERFTEEERLFEFELFLYVPDDFGELEREEDELLQPFELEELLERVPELYDFVPELVLEDDELLVLLQPERLAADELEGELERTVEPVAAGACGKLPEDEFWYALSLRPPLPEPDFLELPELRELPELLEELPELLTDVPLLEELLELRDELPELLTPEDDLDDVPLLTERLLEERVELELPFCN